MNNSNPHISTGSVKRISWSAIFIGAIIAFGISYLLYILNLSMGLSIVSMTRNGIVSIAVSGFILLAIGTISCMFIAGFAAGYLGRPYESEYNVGIVYGFTAWCVALVFTILLTPFMIDYIATYSRLFTHITPIVPNYANYVIPANPDKTIATLGNTFSTSTFLVFCLFFLGALSSCFGGYVGMLYKKNME